MIDFIVYAASQSPWLSFWALPSLVTFLIWSRVVNKPSVKYYGAHLFQWIAYSVLYPMGIFVLVIEVLIRLISRCYPYTREQAYAFFYEPVSLRKESKND